MSRAPGSDTVAIASLLSDQLVRAAQHGRRNRETERLRGFEIDRELESGRALDRQITGSCATQDPVDIARGTPAHPGHGRSIRHEPAILDEFLELVDRRQTIFCRELDQLASLRAEDR